MPLYDFQCRACGARSELLVRASTTPTCPSCGSDDVERVSSFAAAVKSSATRDVVMREVSRSEASRARERVNDQRNYERNHD